MIAAFTRVAASFALVTALAAPALARGDVDDRAIGFVAAADTAAEGLGTTEGALLLAAAGLAVLLAAGLLLASGASHNRSEEKLDRIASLLETIDD